MLVTSPVIHALVAAEPQSQGADATLPTAVIEHLNLPAGSTIQQVSIRDGVSHYEYTTYYDFVVVNEDGTKFSHAAGISVFHNKLSSIEKEVPLSAIPEDISSLVLRVVPLFAITQAKTRTFFPENSEPSFDLWWNLIGHDGDQQTLIKIYKMWDRLAIEVIPINSVSK